VLIGLLGGLIGLGGAFEALAGPLKYSTQAVPLNLAVLVYALY